MHRGAIVFANVAHRHKREFEPCLTWFEWPSGGAAVFPPLLLCSLSEIIIDVIFSSCFYVSPVMEELWFWLLCNYRNL